MEISFTTPEYHADGSFQTARYRFVGSAEEGWVVERNGEEHLSLGPGYRALKTERCGICSTDLARRFLPFPLPQITGHEIVALDEDGQRYVVEINASHEVRGVASDCPLCRLGMPTHCPERLTIGIHDLPGGFGPWILAPLHAAVPVPAEVPSDSAVLIEPFAAALQAVTTIDPRPGDTVAVLGPRRLGMMVVAALSAHRKASGKDYRILALARRASLLELAERFGADEGVLVEAGGDALPAGLADVVVDTTGNPLGLELAIRLAGREVHLKSTHGRPAVGLGHLTELVVDEIALGRFPATDEAAGELFKGTPAPPPKVVWLASAEPPEWLRSQATVVRPAGADAARAELAAKRPELPLADAVVVESPAQVDQSIRPLAGKEVSVVRPRGEILLLAAPSTDDGGSPLLRAILDRGLRLSSSRCGEDFRMALELMRNDPNLLHLGERVVTHHFEPSEIEHAFEVARSPECIKAVVEHRELPAARDPPPYSSRRKRK